MSPLDSDDSRAANTARVLVWLALAVVPAFAATAALTQAYRGEQARQARDWYTRGEMALRSGRPSEAIASFHNALSYSRENQLFRLRLSYALAADGRTAEARAYLLTLRDVQPGNGEVNLALARLAARDQDVASAQRFYRHAIQGAWGEAAEERRRTVRLELAEFLIGHGEAGEARAELIALQGDLPAGASTERRIAALMLEAGLPAQARAIFETHLKRNPRDPDALAGAGRAAFNEGRYAAAVQLLSLAERNHGGKEIEPLLATAQLIVSADPYQRRLTMSARTHRTERALEAARARLLQCSANQTDDALKRLSIELQALGEPPASRAAWKPDTIDSAMDLVFRVERTTADICGAPQEPLDRALLLLAEHAGGVP